MLKKQYCVTYSKTSDSPQEWPPNHMFTSRRNSVQ